MTEGSYSKFNAGMLQINRIGKLQERINYASLDLLGLHPIMNIPNYEVVFASINSLFQEVRPKLSTTEKEEGEEIRDKLKECLEKFPVFSFPKRRYGERSNPVVNKQFWDAHRKLLTIWESKVRQYLEDHNLNSPNQEEEEGYD